MSVLKQAVEDAGLTQLNDTVRRCEVTVEGGGLLCLLTGGILESCLLCFTRGVLRNGDMNLRHHSNPV